MKKRLGEYGFDAPYVPLLMLMGSLPLWIFSLLNAQRGDWIGFAMMAVSALFLELSAVSFLYTTRAGKFEVWQELLTSLHLTGTERILDVGCGRGAVLVLAAKHLTTGRSVGVDMWRARDQSGNGMESTKANALAEGVREKIELHTADMKALPFSNQTFDVVLSSLAIHNIPDAAGRALAIREITRVLKPKGRLMLADFKFCAEYAEQLKAHGIVDVSVRSLGMRFWYGGPWAKTSLVSGQCK
jgi:arsenite methyltransferase